MAAASAFARADLVASYTALADPTTQGFVRTLQGTSLSGPVESEAAFAVGASSLDRYATGDLDAITRQRMLAEGWRVTAVLRPASAPDSRGLVTVNLENLGGRRYDINVGITAGGEAYVRANTGIVTSPELKGQGTRHVIGSIEDFHTITMTFDAGTQSATLAADGLTLLTGYTGHTDFVRTNLGFYLGAYQSHVGHYRSATLEILPSPPTLALLAGPMLAMRRRRATSPVRS